MVTAIADEGFHFGRYKVRSMMRNVSLKPVRKHKFVNTTSSKHDLPIASNVLNRQFNPTTPNLAYVSDITYTRTGARWLSELYQELQTERGFVCSMSRKGNCLDNSVAERFFLNLKMECDWQRQYANHAEAKANITDYIVCFYNCKRINSALGNLSPSVYEREMAASEPVVVSEIT